MRRARRCRPIPVRPPVIPPGCDAFAGCLYWLRQLAVPPGLESGGSATVRSGRAGDGRVVRGDGGEVLDELAAPGGVPGQAYLVGRDVGDVAMGDVRASVEDRG